MGLSVYQNYLELEFSDQLATQDATNKDNYQIKTWALKRTSAYGSDRHNLQTLPIDEVQLNPNEKTLRLYLKAIKPVDVMIISYDIKDKMGNPIKGTIQNTIHGLQTDPRNSN